MPTPYDAPSLTTVDALAQLSFHVQQLLERRAAGHGVSLVQARLLGVLRDREPTMNQLAALLGLDKSSVTGLVARAEARGLVRRRPSTQDGRLVHVVLAAEGRRLVAAVAAEFADDVAELVDPLSVRERDRLTVTLSRLLETAASSRGIEL